MTDVSILLQPPPPGKQHPSWEGEQSTILIPMCIRPFQATKLNMSL